MKVSTRTPPERIGTIAATAAMLPVILWSLAAALPTPHLLDFGSFVASGRAAAAGLDPYGIYELTFRVTLHGFETWNPNLNPPVSLPLFELFDRLAPHQSFRLWWSFSVLCYGATVALLIRFYGAEPGLLAVVWMVALAGFWDTLVLGQIYLPLVLAAVGGWLLLDHGRPVLAGLLIGLVVAVKPNFLVWPALLLLAGHYRVALVAGASAAALSLTPVLIYGPEVYRQWVALVVTEGGRAVFPTNASLAGLLHRAGLGHLDRLAGVATLGALALWTLRRRPSPLLASAVGIVGGILAAPVAWVHYTLFLLPVFMAFRLNLPLKVAAALMLVPVPAVIGFLAAPAWQQMLPGSMYSWAMVLCLYGLYRSDRTSARDALTSSQVEERQRAGA